MPDQSTNPGSPIQVFVTVGADGSPDAMTDPVPAREGDEVRWVFRGNAAKAFVVMFTGAEGSPFDWKKKAGAPVIGTVKKGAAKDGKRTQYKYALDVDGKVRDPQIIIDS